MSFEHTSLRWSWTFTDPARLLLKIHFVMTFWSLFSEALFCHDLVLPYITYKKVSRLMFLFISLSLLIGIIYMNALNPLLCLGYLKCTSNYKPFFLAVYMERKDLFSLSPFLSRLPCGVFLLTPALLSGKVGWFATVRRCLWLSPKLWTLCLLVCADRALFQSNWSKQDHFPVSLAIGYECWFLWSSFPEGEELCQILWPFNFLATFHFYLFI